MDNSMLQPHPPCELCMSATMTVKHILCDCMNLSQARKCSFGSESVTLKYILGDQVGSRIIDFIKMIGLYERV